MKCEGCGNKIEKNWAFCPNCGNKIDKHRRFSFGLPFKGLFENFDKEFKRINELFGRQLRQGQSNEIFPMSLPRMGGISIKITSSNGKEPKIEVKGLGDMKGLNENVHEHNNQFGKKCVKVPISEGPKRAPPKMTEEPKSKIIQTGDKIEIKIDLPGVNSINDIEFNKMGESIEVKAFAREKAYFKLVPVPSGYEVSDSRFDSNVLDLTLERRKNPFEV